MQPPAAEPTRTHGLKRAERALSIMKAGSGWVPDEASARALFGAEVAEALASSGALSAAHAVETEPVTHAPIQRGIRIETNLHAAEWRSTDDTPWFAPTMTMCDRVEVGQGGPKDPLQPPLSELGLLSALMFS